MYATLVNEELSKTSFYLILVTQIVIVLGLIAYDSHRLAPTPILLVLVATILPIYLTKFKALIALIVINLSFYIVLVVFSNGGGWITVLLYTFFQIFAYSTIDISIREQKAKEQLALVNQELLATRYLLKESSKRQERLRISRDLHDSIGHQLTALSLNLEVSKHQVPEEHRPLIEQNLQQSKQLLNDVRDVVKEMRSEDEFDLCDFLHGLVNELPQCQLHVSEFPEINSIKLKQQLVYCLQEGVSNGLRHGNASEFILSGQANEMKINISLKDNGKGCSNFVKGSGLLGMQERLAEFNGMINLQTVPTGGMLTIEVEDIYD